MSFENLNSLETLNIQNNKLDRIPEEVMEPIMDTLRVVDIMGKNIYIEFYKFIWTDSINTLGNIWIYAWVDSTYVSFNTKVNWSVII